MTSPDERANIATRWSSRWIPCFLPLFVKTDDPPLYSTYRFFEKFVPIGSLGLNFF
jgi:hypothetical protein